MCWNGALSGKKIDLAHHFSTFFFLFPTSYSMKQFDEHPKVNAYGNGWSSFLHTWYGNILSSNFSGSLVPIVVLLITW